MSEVSKEYGRALYDIAAEEGKEDIYLSQCRQIADILGAEPDYIRLLCSVNISANERIALLSECFFGRCEEYLYSFMCLLTERGHASEMLGCFSEFEQIYNAAHSIVRAHVTSAVALSSEQREALLARLESYSGKRVVLDERVDAALIGGVRVEIDGELFESSVRSRIDSLRAQLSKTTL